MECVLESARRLLLSPSVPLSHIEELVVAALSEGFTGSRSTLADTLASVTAFFRFARNHGLEHLDEIDERFVEAFIVRAVHRAGVYRDPAPSTVHNRRWEMGELFDTLRRPRLWNGPVLFGVPVSHKNGDATRPLTEREMHAVHVHAYHWLVPTRRPLVVALAEAGGSAAEIATVEAGDIDLEQGTVTFRGDDARSNPIPPVALDGLRAALAAGAGVGERRLTVSDALDIDRAKRSVTQELSSVIRDAGLSTVARVSGRSIALHHALALFHRDGIGAAVRFLGARSVDTTMRSLGLTVSDL
jgi:integrase